MKTPPLPTQLPMHAEKFAGPFHCKGTQSDTGDHLASLTPLQHAWMLAMKPLYYTGKAINDLPHLPQHLRHV